MVFRNRSLDELVNNKDAGWAVVTDWIKGATNQVDVLPCDRKAAEKCLVSMQITTRSPMGAVIYESGGILVDHGWLRVLGSGSPRLPRRLDEWNFGRTWKSSGQRPQCTLIADDVIGGFFALNGGRFGPGNSVFYFAPDSLEWEDMELGFSDFLHWAFTGNTEGFYVDYRWKDWQEEISRLSGDTVYSIHPSPSVSGPPFSQRSRATISIIEWWNLHIGTRLLDPDHG